MTAADPRLTTGAAAELPPGPPVARPSRRPRAPVAVGDLRSRIATVFLVAVVVVAVLAPLTAR